MIKLIPAIKNQNVDLYSSNNTHTNKPLVAYMDLYFEPKTKKSFGLGELLDAAMSGARNKTEESEIATIEDSVTKTVSETKSVSESQLKTKTRSTFVYDEDEYAPRRTYRKKKHKKHNKYKKIHEASLLERIGDGIARILALPFKALFGSKNVTTYQAKDIQSKSIEIRKTKQANIENSKKIQKSFAPQQNQVEVKRLELEKIEELKRLQKTFEQQLNRYKNMFTSDDIKPDLSFFSYQKLPYDELKELLKVLDACIAHQKIIISLKKKFLHKACTYSNQEQNENIHRKNVNDIDGPHYTDKQNYKKILTKCTKNFLKIQKR